jgi:hypothetical protein
LINDHKKGGKKVQAKELYLLLIDEDGDEENQQINRWRGLYYAVSRPKVKCQKELMRKPKISTQTLNTKYDITTTSQPHQDQFDAVCV